MQQLTVNIPDNKIDFFMDLAKNLGFTVEKNTQKNVLTDKQVELVNEARRKIKERPDEFLDWDDVRKTLKTD